MFNFLFQHKQSKTSLLLYNGVLKCVCVIAKLTTQLLHITLWKWEKHKETLTTF